MGATWIDICCHCYFISPTPPLTSRLMALGWLPPWQHGSHTCEILEENLRGSRVHSHPIQPRLWVTVCDFLTESYSIIIIIIIVCTSRVEFGLNSRGHQVSLEIFLAVSRKDHMFIKSNRSHACDLTVFALLISRYML